MVNMKNSRINQIVLVLSISLTVAVKSQFSFATDSSVTCRQNCLDIDRIFCLSSRDSLGTCHSSLETIERNSNICSNGTKLQHLMLFTCPFKPSTCGDEKLLIVNADEQERVIVPGASYVSELKNGAICSYQFKFPQIAGPTDEMLVKIDTQQRVRIYAFQALKFSDSTVVELELKQGDTLKVIYPDTLYLVMATENTELAAYYGIRYSYVNKDPTPEEIEVAEQKIEREIIIEEEYVDIPSKFTDSAEFKIILALIFVAFAVIIFLGIYLYKQNKRNDSIKSKIMILQDAQRNVDGTIQTKTEVQKELDKSNQPLSKPFVDAEADADMRNEMMKAQISSILNGNQQQAQFNTMFAEFLKQQKQKKTTKSEERTAADEESTSPQNSTLIKKQEPQKKRDQQIHPINTAQTSENQTQLKHHNDHSEDASMEHVDTMIMAQVEMTKVSYPTNNAVKTDDILTKDKDHIISLKPNRVTLPPIAAQKSPSSTSNTPGNNSNQVQAQTKSLPPAAIVIQKIVPVNQRQSNQFAPKQMFLDDGSDESGKEDEGALEML